MMYQQMFFTNYYLLSTKAERKSIMKRAYCFILATLLFLCSNSALAAKARSISSDADSAYHEDHLKRHLGDTSCYATGNYIKTRSNANSNKVIGHLEQADEFMLLDLQNGSAKIEITYSHKTSPDSWNGMIGWINSDYIDCKCSPTEYAQTINSAIITDTWNSYNSILYFFYNAIIEAWDSQKIVDSGFCEPYYFPSSLQNDGFVFRDLNSDGTDELIILNSDYFSGTGETFITAIYTLKNDSPMRILESWTRNRHYICSDGSIYNEGSNGASYAVHYLLDLVGTEFIVREGVLSGDYEEHGKLQFGWFLVDERADFSYTDYEMISEKEAENRINQYLNSINYAPGQFISFEQYERSLN